MDLEEKLARLPDHPGVYLMKDKSGEILFVGKASSLKNRVRSYFRGQLPPRLEALMRNVADIDFILTDNEVEALILECNLIKEHQPRYNVNLRDDKSYPYLRITVQEEFPRLEITRLLLPDGSRYFGPYVNAGALRETLRVLRSFFPLRTCRSTPLEGRERPCLNFHIKRCSAPCAGYIDARAYRELVEGLVLFLEGKGESLIKKLKKEMEEAAAKWEFERAAMLRDRIRALENILAQQKVAFTQGEDADFISLAVEGEKAVGLVFFRRQGKVIGCHHFFLTQGEGLSPQELMASLLKAYYSRGVEIPPQVLVNPEPEDRKSLEGWLKYLRGSPVKIKSPKRGPDFQMLRLVQENAHTLLREHLESTFRREQEALEALEELKRFLGLRDLPWRMEAYDISTLYGTHSVGSMVVFEKGSPLPSAYRRFSIKTVQGPDDYASMAEVLRRRFQRGLAGDPKFLPLPDLVLIDGGKGQLKAAKGAMMEVGAGDIPAVALAKREELVYTEDQSQPLSLPRNSKALRLLQRLRDEAHRFALAYHHRQREREAYRSLLEEIPGVGPKRRQALLRHFGSLRRIKEATLEELLQVPGMNRSVALRIIETLGERRNIASHQDGGPGSGWNPPDGRSDHRA
ncbi:MAG TPA: excinuclease ABC subunit UvrC [Moorella mulderi]|nr:excinuclease ABC subunit UvrC [Moorella mulderi]